MPVALASLSGVLLSASGVARSIPVAVALLGLGLALGGGVRRVVAGLALGLLCGWLSPPTWSPDPETPVALIGRLDGHWTRSEESISVAVRGESVRVGREVRSWTERVVVSLPWAATPPGSGRLRVRGYLRRPAPLSNGVGIPRSGWRLYARSGHFIDPLPSHRSVTSIHHLSGRLRVRIRRAIEAPGIFGTPGSHLIRALILGEAWSLPSSWRRGLQALGLSHVVALSGLHVGLFAGLILVLTCFLPMGVRGVAVTSLLGGYLLFVGPRPSLLRACFMLIGLWLALWLDRSPSPGNALVAVAAAMLVADPDLLGDLGFRLTVSATAGIFVISPLLERRWSVLPSWLRQPLSITVGAQLGVLPWALPQFHLLTPLSPLWNLIAVPWTALALAVAVGWSWLAIWSVDLALATAPVVNLVALPFAGVARLPPQLTRPIVIDLGFPAALLLTVLILGVLIGRRSRPVAACLLVLLLWHSGDGPTASPEIAMLDVGQGESLLIRDGESSVLLDGGGWRRADIGSRVLLPVLSRLGVRRLRALALSHPDLDHCGGLVQVASFFPIDEVWSAPGWHPEGCVASLHTLPRVGIRSLWDGTTVKVGRWELRTLNPRPGARGAENDRSLVWVATVNGRRFVLTGDIEGSTERRLLRTHREALRKVDVLKVAHHGSRTSTLDEWIDHVDPVLALISAGFGNLYRHPSPTVLDRLEASGARTLRTDRVGLIRVEVRSSGALRIHLPGSPKPPVRGPPLDD